MPKLPRWTVAEAEKALLVAGFDSFARRAATEFTANESCESLSPFTAAGILHPKIVKQTLEIIDEAAEPGVRRI